MYCTGCNLCSCSHDDSINFLPQSMYIDRFPLIGVMMSLFEDAQEQGLQQISEYGFDHWSSQRSVMLKVMEETQELHVAVSEQDRIGIRHEMGDVLLALASLARHSNILWNRLFTMPLNGFRHVGMKWNTGYETKHPTRRPVS